MIQVDESQLPPEYIRCLQEWAERLAVPVEILVGRIVVAALDGELYVEKIPDYRPE
jgi:hypothetical protein